MDLMLVLFICRIISHLCLLTIQSIPAVISWSSILCSLSYRNMWCDVFFCYKTCTTCHQTENHLATWRFPPSYELFNTVSYIDYICAFNLWWLEISWLLSVQFTQDYTGPWKCLLNTCHAATISKPFNKCYTLFWKTPMKWLFKR